jgi:hypothetical protein
MVELLFSTTSTGVECGWFYVRCVFHILARICMLTCVGSGWKTTWFDHFGVQSG